MHDTDEKKGTSEPLIVEVPSSQPDSLERNSNDPSTSGHNKWRWTTAAGTLTATLVLVLNVVCYVIVTGRYKVNDGFATVYSGDCSEMRSIDTWSSLAINVLSTMLLAASNSGMQCLSAPTRPEISRAHAKGTWLDIGVSSIRNLKHVHGFRVLLWICLGLSSIPLHLMYNSVLFSTLSGNDYMAIVATKNFVQGAPWNATVFSTYAPRPDTDEISRLQQNLGTLTNLSNEDCLSIYYDQEFQSHWQNVILMGDLEVQDLPGQSNSSIIDVFHHESDDIYNDLGWPCGGGLGISEGSPYSGCSTEPNPENWVMSIHFCTDFGADLACYNFTYVEVPIQYCLAQPTAPKCSVKFSPTILVLVIICNAIKAVCLAITCSMPGYRPLLNVGDAISSFLQSPDSTTKSGGPLSAVDIHQRKLGTVAGFAATSPVRRPWQVHRHRWFRAASKLRWTVSGIPMILVWCIAVGLLAQSISWSGWTPGFGTVSVNNLVTMTAGKSITSNVLVANLPQLVLSFVYLFYNNLLTCMLLTAEYTDFATRRKGLRVSSPSGQQRSTYYLQLPYHYAISLMIACGLLHWLVSRSLFLVAIDIYNTSGVLDRARSITACGWSSTPLALDIGLGSLMILTLFGLATFRTLEPGIPITSSCSLAISAACHPCDESEDSTLPLQYGVVGETAEGEHAAFSSRDVRPLVEGSIYI